MSKILRISWLMVLIYVFIIFFPAGAAANDICETKIINGKVTKVNLNTVCSNNSKFTLTLRDYSGNILPGLKFELYEQELDADGLPIAGNRVGSGTINNAGQASFSFKPDQCKIYVLKIWDKRSDAGEFWFFDVTRFVCDYDRYVVKYLPALNIVLRDDQGQLKKNYNFSLYAQKYDVDGNPVFESKDNIGNFQTNAAGKATTYVAPYNPYRRGQSGFYALTTKDASGNATTVYNIQIPTDSDYTFQYDFSGLSGELRDAKGTLLANKDVRLYEQSITGGSHYLGKKLSSTKTDSQGKFSLEYPAGTYAIVVSDDFNQDNIFWDIAVKAGLSSKKLITNLTSFSFTDVSGADLTKDIYLKLYSLASGANGGYYRGKEIGTVKLISHRPSSLSLAAGPYLIVYQGDNNVEYGQAFFAKSGAKQTINVAVNSKTLLISNQPYKISGTAVTSVSSGTAANYNSSTAGATGANRTIAATLKGRILLQVEDKGQAWYVNPANSKKYYLGRPTDAFNVMRNLGRGISNKDFTAVEKNPSAWIKLAGQILIKTEDSGKAYYFDPTSRRLFYLGRPQDAFNVMRSRGLGITNSDLNQISSGN